LDSAKPLNVIKDEVKRKKVKEEKGENRQNLTKSNKSMCNHRLNAESIKKESY
jgi:hypothetical protein